MTDSFPVTSDATAPAVLVSNWNAARACCRCCAMKPPLLSTRTNTKLEVRVWPAGVVLLELPHPISHAAVRKSRKMKTNVLRIRDPWEVRIPRPQTKWGTIRGGPIMPAVWPSCRQVSAQGADHSPPRCHRYSPVLPVCDRKIRVVIAITRAPYKTLPVSRTQASIARRAILSS